MTAVSLPTTGTVGAGAKTKQITGGESISAGEALYKDATTREYMKAKADTEAHAAVEGIAVTDSGDGQAGVIVEEGLIEDLSGLTAGMWYVIDKTTAGDLMPVGDLASTNYSTLVGYAPSTTSFYVKITQTGVALA